MDSKDTDKNIAYQNKDIVSKLFGERMKGKTLSLFGLKTNLKVVDVRPTNIPIVQARELRMDNVFELEDGSVAILDYESTYGVPSEEWMEHAKRSIVGGTVSDETLMKLVLLPLTYKGKERKQQAIKECVQLARQIPDKAQETFALAGLLTFTDKVIDEKTKQYV